MSTTVLFALTSHADLGRTGEPTGFHLGETVTPWRLLRAAGHRVEFVSVGGGMPPMIGHDPADPAQRAFLGRPDGGGALAVCPRPEEVDPQRYGAVYYVGGHGTMWDFRGHRGLRAIGAAVYENGGVVSAICHGPAALVDLRLAGGTPLVAGKELTAFPDDAEAARGLDTVVPFSLQSALEERGALFRRAPDRQPCVVVSERLVTGQNPQSAAGLGRSLVRLLGPAGAAGGLGDPAAADRPPVTRAARRRAYVPGGPPNRR
ncbi:type 1 glutamine amidotransferase domain-containing protein [Streptomyces sp. CAU 1734]|uniref:type 1 glutamine amidotransferase domain-containing protein n=1 Tax=Streptomyces sp. CAU 1734 TaxID=3140360 RepID=UPI00326038C8